MHDFAILTEFCPLKTTDLNGDPVNDPTVFKYYLFLWNTFSEIDTMFFSIWIEKNWKSTLWKTEYLSKIEYTA